MSDIVERLNLELKKPGLIGGRVFAECKNEIERLRADNAQAKLYATELAESVWRRHYKTISPDWKPFCDLLGVLSQLDNMLTGWDQLRAENATLRQALKRSQQAAPKKGEN